MNKILQCTGLLCCFFVVINVDVLTVTGLQESATRKAATRSWWLRSSEAMPAKRRLGRVDPDSSDSNPVTRKAVTRKRDPESSDSEAVTRRRRLGPYFGRLPSRRCELRVGRTRFAFRAGDGQERADRERRARHV